MYPPSPRTVAASSDLLDVHEERIQRLEDNQFTIHTTVTETKVRVEGLTEKVDSMDGKLDKILDGLGQQSHRISLLEGSAARRRSVLKWVGGIVTAVVTAAALAMFNLN